MLGRFRGVAVHDPWAPYGTYLNVEHQLCCAHALRELQGVADTAPPDEECWCWAVQAADALTALHRLVAEAIATGADTLDPDALAQHIRLYRSAAQIGAIQTACAGVASSASLQPSTELRYHPPTGCSPSGNPLIP